jgi:hypothetical protein
MRYLQEPNRGLPDTVSPADFPLGSRQSRAAARLLLSRKRLAAPTHVVFFVHPYHDEKGNHRRDATGKTIMCPLCAERRKRLLEEHPPPRGELTVVFFEGCPNYTPEESTPVASDAHRSTTGREITVL